MSKFSYYGKKLQHLCSSTYLYMACFFRSTFFLISCFHKSILFRVNPFFTHLLYFISISFLGFWFLRILKPIRGLDLFFTSVSCVTVSSMSTLETEEFTNSQLIVIIFLMFIGGEVFTSMVGLYLVRPKFKPWRKDSKIESVLSSPSTCSPRNSNFQEDEMIELDDIVTIVHDDLPRYPVNPTSGVHSYLEEGREAVSERELPKLQKSENSKSGNELIQDTKTLKYHSIKFLGFVALLYLFTIHILGTLLVLVYLARVSSAKDVLEKKGLKTLLFSVFMVVSTFANCGFVPINEGMAVFSNNSGLLLILMPLVLLGNTLYPVFLRLSVKFLGKIKKREEEASYLLENSREIRHLHLLPGLHSRLLMVTVFGFILVQLILFCSLEWGKSGALNGLNGNYQKVVGSLFQVVNARHSGESIVDISTLSPAILVGFIVMMYLPPYTSFIPFKGVNTQEEVQGENQGRGKTAENIILSQLSYLIFFILLVCITERKRMKDDPLNFNVLNITLEVISAYGNVGFTTGYSCDKMIHPDPTCKNKLYGFVGKWSDEGKIILIIVMLFGTLKKFNMQGGKAWKLL